MLQTTIYLESGLIKFPLAGRDYTLAFIRLRALHAPKRQRWWRKFITTFISFGQGFLLQSLEL